MPQVMTLDFTSVGSEEYKFEFKKKLEGVELERSDLTRPWKASLHFCLRLAARGCITCYYSATESHWCFFLCFSSVHHNFENQAGKEPFSGDEPYELLCTSNISYVTKLYQSLTEYHNSQVSLHY